jgi:DNA-binding SARP family transcriptional activator
LAHTVVECPDLCPEPDALMPLASDLLPDWPEDWVAPERERFRQLRLHAVEAVARRLLDRGEVARSVELAVAAAAAAPLRESAHRLAIEAYLAQGRWHDARHQFECCRRALQGELGIEPTDALHDLMRPGLTRR